MILRAVHRDHPLAQQQVPFEWFAAEPFIMRAPSSGICASVEQHFQD